MSSTSASTSAARTDGIHLVALRKDPRVQTSSELCSICLESVALTGQSLPNSCVHCAICREPVTDASFPKTCLHRFCLVCIMEWSKEQWTCPLCKQPFDRLITNVQSVTDYEEVRPSGTEPSDFAWHRRDPRSLLVARIRRLNATLQMADPVLVVPIGFLCIRLLDDANATMDSLLADFLPIIGSIEYRRFLYLHNKRVVPPANEYRYRDCSPWFIKEHPAERHRLVYWLKRELLAVYDRADHQEIISLVKRIIDSVQQVEITSDTFRHIVDSYLPQYTDHFIHEFYSFARSPYGFDEYDLKANYDPILVEQNVELDNGLVIVAARVGDG